MTTEWVFEKEHIETADRMAMKYVLKEMGVRYSEKAYDAEANTFVGVDDDHNKNVFVVGSARIKNGSKKLGFYPGYLDMSRYGNDTFYVQNRLFGMDFLNGDCTYTTIEYLKVDRACFICPIDDSEVFASRVLNKDDLTEWESWKQAVVGLWGTHDNPGLSRDTWVVVSSAKKIDEEYRCFVVNGAVVTASKYMTAGKMTLSEQVPKEVVAYAQRMVNKADLTLPAYVLDVCICNNQYKVLEISPISSAGFYKADVEKLTRTMVKHFASIYG